MTQWHRRYRKRACCHLCLRRLGAPRIYRRKPLLSDRDLLGEIVFSEVAPPKR